MIHTVTARRSRRSRPCPARRPWADAGSGASRVAVRGPRHRATSDRESWSNVDWPRAARDDAEIRPRSAVAARRRAPTGLARGDCRTTRLLGAAAAALINPAPPTTAAPATNRDVRTERRGREAILQNASRQWSGSSPGGVEAGSFSRGRRYPPLGPQNLSSFAEVRLEPVASAREMAPEAFAVAESAGVIDDPP